MDDLARVHDRIEEQVNPVTHRPDTANTLMRSKSYNRHVPQPGFCFPEDEKAHQQNFDLRVSQILKMKNSSAILNSSVVEAWINETLKDAEHLDLPGIVVKPVHKIPMSRYKIDKLFLHNEGIPIPDIERLYRALFVYSIGFYEMLLKSV